MLFEQRIPEIDDAIESEQRDEDGDEREDETDEVSAGGREQAERCMIHMYPSAGGSARTSTDRQSQRVSGSTGRA